MSNTEKEIMNYVSQQSDSLNTMQHQLQNQQVAQMQQERFLEEQERSMVKEQLDLTDELEKINFLLRGYVWDSKKMDWVAPTDDEMVVLTDYGVHLVMNTIQWYINKNTLLSNYDEETILGKMEDFATSLADDIFMEYEKVFKYPKFEDCKKILMERIEYKTKLRKFSLELLGQDVSEEEIKKKFVKDMESRIEEEISKIKEKIIKNKLKRFDLLIRVIQDAVHSTYLRAYQGQERRTLRQHQHISETIGGVIPQNNSGRLSWLAGRSK